MDSLTKTFLTAFNWFWSTIVFGRANETFYCVRVLCSTKGQDAHWPEPNVLTAVGMLHSELERQTEEKTNTAWQFCGQRASLSPKIYVLKASWGPGLAPWTQQLNSGLSCYLTDPVVTWNQHGHRQAAGIGFWWSPCSCCRRNTNSTMTLTATCSVLCLFFGFSYRYTTA